MIEDFLRMQDFSGKAHLQEFPVPSDPDRASASHSLPALGSTGLQAAFQSACS